MIHFFTKGDRTVASSRQRGFLVAEMLMKFGVDARVHDPSVEMISITPWPRKLPLILRSLWSLLSIKRGEIIVLQRTVYNKYFFAFVVLVVFIKRHRMIFDIDDAVYVHIPLKTKVLAKLADTVIVGNHMLEVWAKQYNDSVLLIPTCTDFAPVRTPEFFTVDGSKSFTLGWVGNGPAHLENLAMLCPIFTKLSSRGLNWTFILVGAKKSENIYSLFRDIPGLTMEYIEWSGSEQIPEIISRFDLGLMPLADTEWNRGKCAMKVIEYMACGIPAIASPVGENTYVVKDGENGYLPVTPDHWVEVLEEVYRNPDRLDRLGRCARNTVSGLYTFETNIPHFLTLFKSMTQSL